MNKIDQIKKPYDQLAAMRDAQGELTKTAVEKNVPVFCGVWVPTDEKVYLVSETCLRNLRDEQR